MNTENIIQGRVEDGKLILALAGTIDSSNASAVEKAMQALYREHPLEAVLLDCDQLKYATSAGLRVILRNTRPDRQSFQPLRDDFRFCQRHAEKA